MTLKSSSKIYAITMRRVELVPTQVLAPPRGSCRRVCAGTLYMVLAPPRAPRELPTKLELLPRPDWIPLSALAFAGSRQSDDRQHGHIAHGYLSFQKQKSIGRMFEARTLRAFRSLALARSRSLSLCTTHDYKSYTL